MKLHLVVIAGPDAGARFQFARRETLLVGRGSDCGLVLNDGSVSRLHCRFVADGEEVVVEDAGSRWGTTVNGVPATSARLTPGDVVAIGDTEFRLEATTATGTAITRPNRKTVDEPKSAAPDAAAGASVKAPSAQRAARKDKGKARSAKQERAPAASSRSRPKTPPLRNLEALTGELFLRYRVGAIVARARSGIVFKALDVKQNARLALKVFHPGFLPDLRSTQRFLRGVRTMMPLEHENLVKLHSAGRTRGVCFTVSEFVDGDSLRDLIRQVGVAGMLDWRRAWRIAVGAAQALEFAHERGVIHRNVLPGNILVRRSDQCVKLGDLMLAKALDDAGAGKITGPGEIVGDFSYLAPEQLSDERPVDGRSDLYSLGASLYAVLTGRPPFEGTLPEVIQRVRTESPERPTKRHLAIPPLFEGVILRMLAKRPEERFETATALLKDLRRIGKYLDVR